jgi:tetratricopeptide (TPR) repeat protein
VYEQRSLATMAKTDKHISAAVKTEEAINILTSGEILDATSKLSVGTLAMAQKLIYDLINFAFRRPTISGTLHKTFIDGKETKFLTARLNDKGRSLSWRVDSEREWVAPWEESRSKNEPKTNEEMIDELAYQIFTELAFEKSRMISWKAVGYFLEGLRMYRRCLRNEMDKEIILHKAEKYFMQAAAEDQEFALAYYNLGMVYTEMEELQAARQAFSKALEKSSGEWEIWYALALNLYEGQADLREIEGLCLKARDLCHNIADESKVLELLGRTYGLQHREKEQCKTFKLASFFAISALGRAFFREEDPLSDRLQASGCLKDLAIYYPDTSGEREELLKMALSIIPGDVDLHYYLSILYKKRQDNEKAYIHAICQKAR